MPTLRKISLGRRTFILLFVICFTNLNLPYFEAFGRAGGGRSSGKTSSPSRAAPSDRSNSQQYRSYQDQNSSNSYRPERPQQASPYKPSPYQPAPYQPAPYQPAPSQGGFLRGLAGGVAGGFLGSMLFRSFGNASGPVGGNVGGYGGGMGGGLGILEVLIIGALAFLAFRWWKSKKATAHAPLSYPAQTLDQSLSHNQNSFTNQYSSLDDHRQEYDMPPSGGYDHHSTHQNMTQGVSIPTETASELFFLVQAAWTRRNVASLKTHLSPEILQMLETDLSQLLAKKQINRLENISVRKTEIMNSWREPEGEFSTVRFLANLLDYNVDESTNKLISGSDTEPVKFEEDWIFKKSSDGLGWQLVGIQQLT